MITPLTKQIVGTPCKLQRQPQRPPAQTCKHNCGVFKLFENTSEIRAKYAGNTSKLRAKYAEGGFEGFTCVHACKIRTKYINSQEMQAMTPELQPSCTAQATKYPGKPNGCQVVAHANYQRPQNSSAVSYPK